MRNVAAAAIAQFILWPRPLRLRHWLNGQPLSLPLKKACELGIVPMTL